jgi:hypothetical protein
MANMKRQRSKSTIYNSTFQQTDLYRQCCTKGRLRSTILERQYIIHYIYENSRRRNGQREKNESQARPQLSQTQCFVILFARNKIYVLSLHPESGADRHVSAHVPPESTDTKNIHHNEEFSNS